MIYVTHYTADDLEPTGPSMPSGYDSLQAVRYSTPGRLIQSYPRILIYGNGDGTRLCFSDFPFNLAKVTT